MIHCSVFYRGTFIKLALAQIVCVLLSTYGHRACACNIPVYRYALERWQADKCQLLVFHEGKLTDQHERILAKLAGSSATSVITANLEIRRISPGPQIDKELKDVWQSVQQVASKKMPYAILRQKLAFGRFVNVWQGAIEDLDKLALNSSPARKRLAERIMAGDAVVWLLLKSPDESKNEAVRVLLKKQFERLEKQIKLPEGIGLPGSELFADVPLLVQFSFLEIDPQDPQEAYLVKLMSGIDADAVGKGEPLLAPVFGRGRALEILPASMLNEGLVEDLTIFLCGACSCQVKEKNPGFDLLLDVHWEKLLFGEDGEIATPADQIQSVTQPKAPVLLTIPPGRKK